MFKNVTPPCVIIPDISCPMGLGSSFLSTSFMVSKTSREMEKKTVDYCNV